MPSPSSRRKSSLNAHHLRISGMLQLFSSPQDAIKRSSFEVAKVHVNKTVSKRRHASSGSIEGASSPSFITPTLEPLTDHGSELDSHLQYINDSDNIYAGKRKSCDCLHAAHKDFFSEHKHYPPATPDVLTSIESFDTYLMSLQQYLRSFHYHLCGFELTSGVQNVKHLPICNAYAMARSIIIRHYPIKCLEAVLVALWLTRNISISALPSSTKGITVNSAHFPATRIVRLPLRFRSVCGRHSYWHIVCVLMAPSSPYQPTAYFGSIGLSRAITLDYRPLAFTRLSSLVESFSQSYSAIGHTLVELTVGLPISTKEWSRNDVCWHFLSLPLFETLRLHRVSRDSSYAKESCILKQNNESDSMDNHSGQNNIPVPPDDTCNHDGRSEVEELVHLVDSTIEKDAKGNQEEINAEWKLVLSILDCYTQQLVSVERAMRNNFCPVFHPQLYYSSKTRQLIYKPLKLMILSNDLSSQEVASSSLNSKVHYKKVKPKSPLKISACRPKLLSSLIERALNAV